MEYTVCNTDKFLKILDAEGFFSALPPESKEVLDELLAGSVHCPTMAHDAVSVISPILAVLRPVIY